MKITYRQANAGDFEAVYAIASGELNNGQGYRDYVKGLFDRLGHGALGILAFDRELLIGFAFLEQGMVLTGDRTDYLEEIRRDIGNDEIWSGAAFAVLDAYQGMKIGSALFLHGLMALSGIGVKHLLLEIWVRPDGYMPSNTNLATAGSYTEYGIVPDFYYDASRNGYLCPVCGDECHCSAKIAVVHITI